MTAPAAAASPIVTGGANFPPRPRMSAKYPLATPCPTASLDPAGVTTVLLTETTPAPPLSKPLSPIGPRRRWVSAAVLAAATTLLLVPNPWGATEALQAVKRAVGPGYGVHFATYAIVTAAVAWMFVRDRRRWLPWVYGGLAVHAVATETAQAFIPARDADPLDLLANLCGIAVGVGLLRLLSIARGWVSASRPATG